MEKKDIEIPFGACDSELDGFEYTIPEGYKAEIKDGKVVVKKTESEDEKIRKMLIEFFRDWGKTRSRCWSIFIPDILVWLKKQGKQKDILEDAVLDSNKDGLIADTIRYKREKQGEQKPAWSDEDEVGLGDAMWAIEQARNIAKDENDMGNLWYAEHWLESLKDRVQPQPKQEWSEEDKRMLCDTIAYVEAGIKFDGTPQLNWLKSLRPQSTWKPSDEQMEALLKLEEMHVLEHEKNQENAHLYMMVKSIREQLLKLTE